MAAEKTSKNKIRVRKAKIEDLPPVVDLWKEFMAHHRRILSRMKAGSAYKPRKGAEKEFAQYFLNATGDPDWLVLVATCDERVVAYTIASIIKRPPILAEKNFCFISDMMVAEKYRRHCAAKALVEKTLSWFRRKKLKTVELNVLLGNEAAEDFWNELGFTTALTRKIIRL